MNTARLNFTRLNTSVLNASLLNSSLMGGSGKGSSSRPSGLIAQYKPYLNSNDSPTRDVLKDYSGHGNDVVLHNFAFTEESGYNTTTYPGALVSDVVDDYGVCETPLGEVGTVIVMLDEIKWDASKYLYNAGTGLEINSNRIFCWRSTNGNIASGSTNEEQGDMSKQTPIDGKFIVFTRNPNEITSDFYLFGTSGKGGASVALYALEIYDRDLSEEEIEQVKQRMIAEYEKATGNVLEGTILLEDGTYLLLEDGTSLLME